MNRQLRMWQRMERTHRNRRDGLDRHIDALTPAEIKIVEGGLGQNK